MLRIVFWLLLLANLVFFALIKWGNALTRSDASLLAQPPLHPEKVRLLVNSTVAAQSAVMVPASAPLSAPSATQPTPMPLAPQAASAPPAPQAPSPAVSSCLEWGEFSGADLASASANLGKLKLGDRLSRREVEHNTGYWVYIPPQRTRAEINQKLTQLKKLGVDNHFVVQEKGKWHNAISLGVFKSRDLAQKFLASLKSKGVKNAEVGERQAKLKLVIFTLRNPDAGSLSRLTEWQKDFTDIEMKSVRCN